MQRKELPNWSGPRRCQRSLLDPRSGPGGTMATWSSALESKCLLVACPLLIFSVGEQSSEVYSGCSYGAAH
jgi:hypothetical protein